MSSFLAFGGSLYSMPATHAEDDDRRTILVVDDDENLRTVLEYSLQRAGYAVLSAGNARDAQRLVATSQVALILLDLYLPGFDGFSLLLELKSHPSSQQIPVVVLTAYCDEEHRRECLSGGASAFVCKPFSPQGLIEVVDRLVDESSAR